MIAAVRLDAVVIVSPVETHAELAAVASSAGLGCLVEKPPSTDATEAERMAELDPAPLFGFNRRFGLGSGLRESTPTDGSLRFRARLDYRRRSWDAVSIRDDALIDLGTHLIDLVLWSTGADPVSVRCEQAEAERAALVLETTRGDAELSCSTASLHREMIEVRDSDGRRLHRRRIGGPVAALVGRLRPGDDALTASIEAQLDRFADASAAMRVVDAARESARRDGAAIAIEGPGG